MRNASGALISLLNTADEFAVADCLTIVQANGVITRLTSASQPIVVVSQYDNASHTFNPTFPFTRGQTKLVIGTEVDSLRVTLSPDPVANLLGGIPWPAAARAGALDNAEVLLEKCIMATFGVTTPGTLILFWGIVGSPQLSRSTLILDVQSEITLLQAQFPRNVYQPGCLNTLYDAACTLSGASFADTGTVSSGTTASLVKTNSNKAATYFDLGALTFTSGALNGKTFPVKSYALPSASHGEFTPVYELPVAPSPGDTWSAVAGCDKKQSTCTTKFSNLVHFRGLPVIPAAETAR